MAASGPPFVVRVLSVLVLGAVTACAAATRPPVTPKASGSSDEPIAAEGAVSDEDAEPDADGEVEAVDEPTAESGPLPKNMALVATETLRVCVDKYEGSLVETMPDGSERAYPHWLAVDGHSVRAVSQPAVFPQGYISEVQAEDACAASGKRLCTYGEWKTACMGPSKKTFPYGDMRQPGTCNDTGKSAVGAVFGNRAMTDPVALRPAPAASGASKSKANRPASSVKGRASITTKERASAQKTGGAGKKGRKARATASAASSREPAKASSRPASVEASVWSQLNDPRLGQVDGALARTGSFEACVNGFGLADMVGNVHEWVKTSATAPHGTFAGGYYLDTSINGDGCNYRTTAHAHDYHDYSTGFRCCAEPH
jgi:formylglycine-generating enzyme required for sulfatase activity